MERAQGGRVKVTVRTGVVTGEGSAWIPAEGVVHLWSWLLPVEARTLSELEATLSADEWWRVRRMASHHHAGRFVSGRGMVRRILGSYLDLPPRELRFRYGRQGKPELDGFPGDSLAFNFSDSYQLAVLSVVAGHPIGVDVERIRHLSKAEAVSASGSAGGVSDRIRGVEELREAEAFLRAWTRKEAAAKAEGSGLQLLSEALAQSLPAPARRPRADDFDEGPNRWRVYPLPLPAGYAGALAASRPIETIICFPCSPELVPASDR